MKIKVRELTGLDLDKAVAIAEGYLLTSDSIQYLVEIDGRLQSLRNDYSPSTKWSTGGPIIERAGISFVQQISGSLDDKINYVNWSAKMPRVYFSDPVCDCDGTTQLEAAMRCFVRSRLGDEVSVPAGLK